MPYTDRSCKAKELWKPQKKIKVKSTASQSSSNLTWLEKEEAEIREHRWPSNEIYPSDILQKKEIEKNELDLDMISFLYCE